MGANKKNQRGYDINKKSLEFFKKNINDRRIIKYLAKRELSKNELIKFEVGYSGSGLTNFLLDNGFSENEIVEWGLAKRRGDSTIYDYFINRLMFPIKDVEGRVIGFSGRRINDDEKYSKYLNSQENALFKKGEILYNVDIAKNNVDYENGIIVVEGFMDVIALSKLNVNNVVATMGTAFTKRHAEIIVNFTNKVTLGFDSDNAGLNATIETGKLLLKERIDTYVLSLNGGKDFDELIKCKNFRIKRLLANAQRFLVFYKNLMIKNIDVHQFNEGNIDKIFEVLIMECIRINDAKLINKHSNEIDVFNLIKMIIFELSYVFKLDVELLQESFNQKLNE